MTALLDSPHDAIASSGSTLTFDTWPTASPAELLALRHALTVRSETTMRHRASTLTASWIDTDLWDSRP